MPLQSFLRPKYSVHPPAYRVLELVAFILFCAFVVLSVSAIIPAISTLAGWRIAVSVVIVVAIAMLLADLVSGVIHFMGDTFGTPETPFFGQNFIFPFREHHVDPLAITRHDFFDVNGSNLLVSLPILIPMYYWLTPLTSLWYTFLLLFIVCFLLFIFLTNQIHKWAHSAVRPAWVTWIQQRGWILSPEHHSIHHTSPYDTYFCITAGWWNPVLEKTGIFKWLASKYKGQVVRPKAVDSDLLN